MELEESPGLAGSQRGDQGPEAMDDAALEQTIVAQREAVADCERLLAPLRERFDHLRRTLRDLEAERERRRLATTGAVAEKEKKPRRKRSSTGMDALLGRDGIDPERPFSRLRLLSLQRQEVLLNRTGDRERQILGFTDPATGSLSEAHSFGEGRRLQEQGCQLGWPGVPLQRQPVWYIAEGRPGWLRLDQLFVEQDAEDD